MVDIELIRKECLLEGSRLCRGEEGKDVKTRQREGKLIERVKSLVYGKARNKNL